MRERTRQRVSQSQYLGQGQKVLRSPRHWEFARLRRRARAALSLRRAAVLGRALHSQIGTSTRCGRFSFPSSHRRVRGRARGSRVVIFRDSAAFYANSWPNKYRETARLHAIPSLSLSLSLSQRCEQISKLDTTRCGSFIRRHALPTYVDVNSTKIDFDGVEATVPHRVCIASLLFRNGMLNSIAVEFISYTYLAIRRLFRKIFGRRGVNFRSILHSTFGEISEIYERATRLRSESQMRPEFLSRIFSRATDVLCKPGHSKCYL